MDTRYIYAGTRAKTLENNLLTETQLERLLTAKSVPEAFKTLQDTFLAPYLAKHEKTDLSLAIEQSLAEAKKILTFISPDPNLLDILWLKYDYHNLKTIIKGKIAGLSDEEIKANCFNTGKFETDKLLKAYDEKKLRFIDNDLEDARAEAEEYKEIADIDIILNNKYLEHARKISKSAKNGFVKQYVSIIIDLYNLKSALRTIHFVDKPKAEPFISRCQFDKKDLEDEKNVLDNFKRFGGEKMWSTAIEDFKKTGDFSLIEKASDEYVFSFMKIKSYDMFSPASLFSYFSAMKNNVQIIRIVITGKKAGLPESEIRFTLRKLYINYE